MSHINFDIIITLKKNIFPSNGRISFVVGDLVNSDLSEAVKGVDAVVSCIIGDRSVTVEGQKRLIDASKAAGTVKQFIPSAFSFDYRQAKVRNILFLLNFTATVNHIFG